MGHGGARHRGAVGDVGAAAVLNNTVIVGSVNANKRHWFKATEGWAVLTGRGWPPGREALRSRIISERGAGAESDDIKVVIQFSEL